MMEMEEELNANSSNEDENNAIIAVVVLPPDNVVLCCLFNCGFFFGYYCKFVYIYDNLWHHWYAVLGALVALALAAAWTFKKYKQKHYRFDHFYVIFYGLMCFVISGCFMLSENLDIGFYFGFIGLGTIYIPCFSFISLRCSSRGLRPARIALGNAMFFAGLTTGFSIFNEFEARQSGWIYLGITLAMIFCAITNEILQHIGLHNYKQSSDLVFNLMNEESLVFLPTKSIYALFVGRPEFSITRNRQWLVVGLSVLIVLERLFVYSTSYLQLSWSATLAYVGSQHLYLPFMLYAVGCAIGSILIIRYKPKLLYLMFGLTKITALAALMGVYSEDLPENSFIFVCFYYVSMGIYSSVATQMLLECTPFLYTELAVALAFSLELLMLELLKYETKVESSWSALLGSGIAALVLTVVCMGIVQVFLPCSEGLVEVRNKLLGVRRHSPVVPQSKIWNTNYFLHHDLQPNEVTSVKLHGNRVFQQYPRQIEKKLAL